MRPVSLPSVRDFEQCRKYTAEDPCRILCSACLLGDACLTDGNAFSEPYQYLRDLGRLPNVRLFKFCPEDFSLGTPRGMPDIHGGNGLAVLQGAAKVLDENGLDLTEKLIQSAQKMLLIAQENQIDFAILLDMSASCGSQVISDGSRLVADRKYQKGPGVCAALLIENGVKVISQRDYKTLALLRAKLDPEFSVDPDLKDHHETDWYREYFSSR